MKITRVEQTSYDEVKRLHNNSDIDESPRAQHHTLGILPNQASPGDHIHDGRTSKKIDTGNLDSPDITYQPAGGTLGTQPTFNGAPMIYGSYTKLGSLVYFEIRVEFDNITSFGTGQYYLTLPFNSAHALHIRNGCLHDASGSDQYAISGHVAAGSNQLRLFSTASNGRDVPYEHDVPVVLAVQDNFHIAGTYQISE